MNKNIISLIDYDFYNFLLKYYNSKSSEYYCKEYSFEHFLLLIYYSFNKINFSSKNKIYNELASYLEKDYKVGVITKEQYINIRKMYIMLSKELSFIKSRLSDILLYSTNIMAGSIAKYDNMIDVGDNWNKK